MQMAGLQGEGLTRATESYVTASILTKTIVPSSVVHWIYYAQIRQSGSNDLVLIGDDFVEVKTLAANGVLLPIATKRDFDSRICAAKVLDLTKYNSQDGTNIKTEGHNASPDDYTYPPQALVVTLESSKILFIVVNETQHGGYHFIHRHARLPKFESLLRTSGCHLAIDPGSKALAVAARESEVVLFNINPSAVIKQQLRAGDRGLQPLSTHKVVRLAGTIHLVDFLTPPANDENHLLLLVVLIEQHVLKAVLVEWYTSSEMDHIYAGPALPLETTGCVPNLLIPLQYGNAAFLLVIGDQVYGYTDILSGSVNRINFGPNITSHPALFPGASPRKPLWSAWCRPAERYLIDDAEQFYMTREDGLVLLLGCTGDRFRGVHVGNLDCLCGRALTSVAVNSYSDILIAYGDMSSGSVLEVSRSYFMLDVEQPLQVELIGTVPNWASVTDMATSTTQPIQTKRQHGRLFLTSGRQPYGCITEMRYGMEARLSLYFDLPFLSSITNIWSVPGDLPNSTLIILSGPNTTWLLLLSLDADADHVEELNESDVSLVTSTRTLAVDDIGNGKIIQITEKAISSSSNIRSNSESPTRIGLDVNHSFIAATINGENKFALVIGRRDGPDPYFFLSCYSFHSGRIASAPTPMDLTAVSTIELAHEPLSVYSIVNQHNFVLVTTVAGKVELYCLQPDKSLVHLCSQSIPVQGPSLNTCDALGIIQSNVEKSKYLVLCGLRGGRIHRFIFAVDKNIKDIRLQARESLDFSQTAVKFISSKSKSSPSIFAISQTDMCLLSWDGRETDPLRIRNIWVTDRERPELAQTHITSCAPLRSSCINNEDLINSSMVMVSGGEILVAELSTTEQAVPRQIRVSGTPSRLLIAEQHRSLVCASICYGVSHFTSANGKPEERRQLWPVIDFIPMKGSTPSFSHKLQPGQRIYALLEWSFRTDEQKTYSFILIGGSYVKSNGTEKGRLTFLQPLSKNWQIYGVNEGRTSNFEAPIHALALWDEITYIACSGQFVHIHRFQPDNLKWHELCPPLKIASVGISISVRKPAIYISTARDSLVRLVLSQEYQDSLQRYELVLSHTGPRADALLNHIVPINRHAETQLQSHNDIAIAATKEGRLIGVRYDTSNGSEPSPRPAEILFEAQLNRSLTRLRQCDTRPSWKRKSIPGVLVDDIIGSATDGSLVGGALISEDLYRRLSWVQRLCERSSEICPHTFRSPAHSVVDPALPMSNLCIVPAGLATGGKDEIILTTTSNSASARHIDGDILQRLLNRGGAELLKHLLCRFATQDDRMGQWIHDHLDQELRAAEEIVPLVQSLLNCWL